MEELLSPDGLNLYKRTNQVPLDFGSALMLEGFRAKIGHPLKVNHAGLKLRGYRSHEENASIEGSANDCLRLAWGRALRHLGTRR